MPSGDGRKERQVETVITASPHAFDPAAHHNLPPEEQEKFLQKMDAYCMQIGCKSLDDWRQEYLQEQSSAAMTDTPQM